MRFKCRQIETYILIDTPPQAEEGLSRILKLVSRRRKQADGKDVLKIGVQPECPNLLFRGIEVVHSCINYFLSEKKKKLTIKFEGFPFQSILKSSIYYTREAVKVAGSFQLEFGLTTQLYKCMQAWPSM